MAKEGWQASAHLAISTAGALPQDTIENRTLSVFARWPSSELVDGASREGQTPLSDPRIQGTGGVDAVARLGNVRGGGDHPGDV